MKRFLAMTLAFALAAGAAMGVAAEEEMDATLPVEAAVEEQEDFELEAAANNGEAENEGSDVQQAPEGEPAAETAPEDAKALERRTRRIQSWLIALSYLRADQQTGEYDEATRAAVAGFQADRGLEATGECDEATYALLRDAAAALNPTPKPDAPGTTPTPTPAPAASPTAKEIKQAQKLLVTLKYLSAEDVTGEMDDATVAALLKLQADNEMEETGLLDALTLALIEKLAEEAGESGRKSSSSGSSSGSSSSKSSSGSAAGSAAASDPRLHGVTPGKALTSSHSKGAKDASRYGSVDLSGSAKALNVTLMTGEGDGALSDGSYRAQVESRVLTLAAGGETAMQRWEFDGAALRALNRSGVDRLTLSCGSRHTSLPTADTLTGPVYEGLRARGFTDNTFVYHVTLSENEVTIAVEAMGQRYAAEKGDDGALVLSGEES